MSSLLLVRHGQARAFEADSDRLTPCGEEQAARVGAFLARTLPSVEVACSGTLTRQRGTAAFVKRAFEAAGKPFPELEVDPAWNEYDADGILGRLLPELVQRDPGFAALTVEFREKAADPDRNRYFQRMFEVLMDAWASGAVAHGDVEGAENVRRSVADWLKSMKLIPAGPDAEIDRYIGYFEPYATSHDALDKDADIQAEVRIAAEELARAMTARREGRLAATDEGLESPRQK